MLLCGRRAAFSPDENPHVALKVEAGTGRTFFSGCIRCNSVWECPVCAPRIMAGRAEELQTLNDAHRAAGGALYLLTLTLPHDEGDALKPLRKQVSRAWSNVTRGAPWKRWRERLGIVGTVRALEVTHGRNGWHPHLHVALYCAEVLADSVSRELTEFFARQWRRYVTERTPEGKVYRAPSAEHGVTLQPLASAQYLTKMGLAGELTLSNTKEGREGHRTPWQILRDLTRAAFTKGETGEDRQLWCEFARSIKGARQLTYSKGLRQRYALPPEQLDAELADTQGELEGVGAGDAETVFTWTPKEWLELCRLPVAARLAILQVPSLPRAEWSDALQKILDDAHGLPAVPF